MSIAISEEHQSLSDTASSFLQNVDAIMANRNLLDATDETLPPFWANMAEMGWLGLHIPEDFGGSGYGLAELSVVVEQLGAFVAPGPFVPTATASAVINAAAGAEIKERLLPGLADGSLIGGIALGEEFAIVPGSDANGQVAISGTTTVVSGGQADVIVARLGADVLVIETDQPDVTTTVPANLDPARRIARVSFDGATATKIDGAAATATALIQTVFAAEACGVARRCTENAAAYAKERKQFGRPIAMFQAVKHHCANMAVATEMATAAAWDAARAADESDEQGRLAGAIAAVLAGPAADLCANLNTQVHGGIAITIEHDAHLYMRRATQLLGILPWRPAAENLVDQTRSGVTRSKAVALPPEAEAIRETVVEFVDSLKGLSTAEKTQKLVSSGYGMPHWPAPYGRAAGAVEQLVIEEEFKKASVHRPVYGITGWVILTIIQHGTADQVARWVEPALQQEVIWCQLFSEPDAGSDAAAVTTRAVRTDGGWLVTGQKVWTSGAHVAGMGFATVRTNPDVPKHQGISMMAIDMHADGVEVRPITMPTGDSEFNEVFFDNVFVPDEDVVGPIDGGWTVARATLGNESVSIGGGEGGLSIPGSMFLPGFDAHPERLDGGAARLGRYIANHQAMGLLNLRRTHRAVAGAEPGPEGAMTKLVLSELGHDAAAISTQLNGPDAAFMDGPGGLSNRLVLMHRGMSIAGGTSEIKRNQIGERILGLPRDPLIK